MVFWEKKKSYNKFESLYGSSGPNLIFVLKCDWLDWDFFILFYFLALNSTNLKEMELFQIRFGPLPNVVLKLIQNRIFWNPVSVLRRCLTGFRIPCDFYVILNQLFSSTILGERSWRCTPDQNKFRKVVVEETSILCQHNTIHHCNCSSALRVSSGLWPLHTGV